MKNDVRRRDFLTTAATTAGVIAAGGVASTASAAESNASSGDIVPLGSKTGLKATRIGAGTGMGGWMRASNQTRLGEKAFSELINYEYDKGVRLFDSADIYGSGPFLGRALKGKPRDSYFLVSKIWYYGRGTPEDERPEPSVYIERFLKEFQTDYIDLVQIHCTREGNWPELFSSQMEGLAKMKEKGLIRAHGTSCHSIPALEAAAKEPWVDVVHARINPFEHRTDGPMDKVLPILRRIHDQGKGIIGMKLVGEGSFDQEKRDKALDFVMGTGLIDTMIVGFEDTDQVDQFVGSVQKRLDARKA